MTDLDHLPATIRKTLSDISEAANLPADNLGLPNIAEGPADLHERLLVTRSAMTRVGELVGELVLLHGRVKRTLIDRRGELDDAEASMVSDRRPVFTEDFSSAKEKNARLAAGTIEPRRAVRQIEKLQADVDAALSYARDRHRELDRAVRDIDTRLRIFTFEPNAS